MTAYQNLRDHIEQGYTQTAIAYMEMRTGISRNFIQLGVDEQDRIRISFSVPRLEISPYRYGATITPEWDTLEKNECARNLSICLGWFVGRQEGDVMEAELRLHQQTQHDLPAEYFPKYSYHDLETEFVHLLGNCAMSGQHQMLSASFHGHIIEVQVIPERQTIQTVLVDGMEVYDAAKGAVGHEGIAGLMTNALCDPLYKEEMYDCERTIQEFDETYGISQLNECGEFAQEQGSGLEINWMNDLMFDPIGKEEWER